MAMVEEVERINKLAGQKIREIRKSQGLSQEKMAKMLEVKGYKKNTKQNINLIEQGKVSINISMIIILAEIFQVDVSYFLKTKTNFFFKNKDDEKGIIISVKDKGNNEKFVKIIREMEKLQDNPDILDNLFNIIEQITSLKEIRDAKVATSRTKKK